MSTTVNKIDIVPIHKKLKVKTFDNGLKVYLLSTSLPQESCELRLIVRVGSINESDAEQGMAHFIEHLGFKGTRSFQSYELVKALESLGIAYGPDMNASTDLSETKYRLTNLSLSSDLNQIKLGLKILYEWAFEMTISDSDVEEEKQVIFAEYRAKQGLGQRLLKKYWPAVFGQDSMISNRFPIGIPEVFMALKSSDLRRFYDTWYRPENMCIICTGDIEAHMYEIESLINTQFDVIRSIPTYPSENSDMKKMTLMDYFPIKDHDTIISLNDSQVSIPQVCFEYCWCEAPSNSIGYYKSKLTLKVIASVLNHRFSKIVKGYDVKNPYIDRSSAFSITPLIGAGVSVRDLVRGYVCYGITFQLASGFDKKMSMILSLILYEFKRLEIHGVSEVEFKKAIMKWKTRYTEMEMNAERESGGVIATDIEEHFLWNEQSIMTSSRIEASMGLDILNIMTCHDIKHAIKFLNFHIPSSSLSGSYDKSGLCRVLSTQFRGTVDVGVDGDDYLSDTMLSSCLSEARDAITILSESSDKIVEWPLESTLEADDVINAAKRVLGIEMMTSSSTSSLVDRNDDIMTSCTCCASVYCNACASTSSDIMLPPTTSSSEVKHGSVDDIERSFIPSISTHHIVLKNGINICLKYLPQESANKISFQGFALQGISELSSSDGCAFAMLDDLASASGFNIKGSDDHDIDNISYPGPLIQDLQNQTNTSVSTQRHYHHRGIGGSCPSSNIELLLAFLCLRLSPAQVFNGTELEKQKQSFINSSTQEFSSPYHVFLDRARILTCGDIPICRPYDSHRIQGITLAQVEDLYYDSFVRDPTQFTFVFIGDLPVLDKITSLLDHYLGKLKSNDMMTISDPVTRFEVASLPFKVVPVTPTPHKVKETLYQEIEEDKASCMMIFLLSTPCNDTQDFEVCIGIDMLCKILQSRLLDTLRMKLGKVYFVSVERSRNSLSPTTLISIGFHSGAEDMDQLQALIEEEIINLQRYGPNEEVLSSVKESMMKGHKMNMTVPSYWLFWILDSFKSYKVYDIEHKKKMVSGMNTVDDEQHRGSEVVDSVVDYMEAAVQRRGAGRMKLLEQTNVDDIRVLFQKYFDVDKAVTIDLRSETRK